jgi:glutaredoxin-like YruB-family protein
MANVTIYTTPTCGYCKSAKAFFKDNNVEYTEHDVANDSEKANEMIQKSGQMGVPVIEVDNEIIVGFDQSKLSDLLKIK